MPKILVAGLDGSKTNFGIATMWLDTETLELTVDNLTLVKTEKSKNKQVRASSDNLRRAQEVSVTLRDEIDNCIMCFAEVPSGGQSYDAVLGFGIVIGLYASIETALIEVSPRETKLATVGTSTASKEEMIEWATEQYPDAPWRMRKLHGKMVPKKDNEHLADACAIVQAGIITPEFKNILAMLNATAKSQD